MKFANMVFGFVLFSVVVTVFFGAAKELTQEYGTSKQDDFAQLAGKYNFVQNLTTEQNSTLRRMNLQSEQGEASSEDRDIFLISGALSSVRLVTNIIPITTSMIELGAGDTSTYIPRIVIDVILGLIAVFVFLVIIHFLRGFSTEV